MNEHLWRGCALGLVVRADKFLHLKRRGWAQGTKLYMLGGFPWGVYQFNIYRLFEGQNWSHSAIV